MKSLFTGDLNFRPPDPLVPTQLIISKPATIQLYKFVTSSLHAYDNVNKTAAMN